jgi:hypothetical protein
MHQITATFRLGETRDVEIDGIALAVTVFHGRRGQVKIMLRSKDGSQLRVMKAKAYRPPNDREDIDKSSGAA